MTFQINFKVLAFSRNYRLLSLVRRTRKPQRVHVWFHDENGKMMAAVKVASDELSLEIVGAISTLYHKPIKFIVDTPLHLSLVSI